LTETHAKWPECRFWQLMSCVMAIKARGWME
jgi:hypothetical protein